MRLIILLILLKDRRMHILLSLLCVILDVNIVICGKVREKMNQQLKIGK